MAFTVNLYTVEMKKKVKKKKRRQPKRRSVHLLSICMPAHEPIWILREIRLIFSSHLYRSKKDGEGSRSYRHKEQTRNDRASQGLPQSYLSTSHFSLCHQASFLLGRRKQWFKSHFQQKTSATSCRASAAGRTASSQTEAFMQKYLAGSQRSSLLGNSTCFIISVFMGFTFKM